MDVEEEDWQAQVEELVALQSIFGEAHFRLLTAPEAAGGDPADGGGSGGPAAASTSGAAAAPPPQLAAQDDEAWLAGMLGRPRPAGAAAMACEVLAEVELPPGGLQVSLPAQDGGGSGGGGDDVSSSGGGGIPVGAPVRWLPPLRVAFELPAGYPSARPPAAAVRAAWLSPAQARALERGLAAAWEEQGAGCPVLFAFLDWLRESALQHLGVGGALLLCGGGGGGGSGGGGSGGGSEGSGGEGSGAGAPRSEEVAMQLMRYHAAKEQEEFEAGLQRCSVCLDELPGAACLRLPGCRHHFCRACLRQLCATNVKDGAVEALRCPEPGCRLPLPPHVLRSLLAPGEFERWEGLLLQRTLDRMQDLVYCPRCETPCIEDPDHFAQCDACLYAFCSMCFGSWHPGVACVDEEQKLLIMKRRHARGGAGAKDARAEMDLVQQLASLRVLKETSKPCPGCKFPIEKTEGCNKMTCAYCSSFWCWRCEKVITGYDHFKDGGCRLFEQAEIDRWNALFAAERAGLQLAGGGGGGGGAGGGGRGAPRQQPGGHVRRTHCPGCGQASFQADRNNLVRCWACASHYCAACGKQLRGKVGQHYIGANACKQHA